MPIHELLPGQLVRDAANDGLCLINTTTQQY